MHTNQSWRSGRYGEKEYKHFEDCDIEIWHTGNLFSWDGTRMEKDALKIAKAVLHNVMDFNNIHGFYKIVVLEKKSGNLYFWGDNSGTQNFYLDEEENTFYDSFLFLCKQKKDELQPNYAAIYQLLADDYIFTDETIVKGVKTTSAESYYVLSGGKIEEKDKKLKPFTQLPGLSLHDYMKMTLESVDDKMCAVCTGGTDSRTVLSHLHALGKKPDLVITGHPDNPDIRVAREIADTLHLSLEALEVPRYDEGWFEESIAFSDGVFDPVLSYRHLKKMKWATSKKFSYEFGGVGGEFYKNKYCAFFQNKLFRKDALSTRHILRSLFKNMICPKPWMGELCVAQKDLVISEIEKSIDSISEEGLLRTYNRIGSFIMRQKQKKITINYTDGISKIDPLVDRDVIAQASAASPFSHSMESWHRREVTQYCKEISRIKTDQGYTLSTNPFLVIIDAAKRLSFYWGRIMLRLRNKLHIKTQQRWIASHYWDSDYAIVAKQQLFTQSLDVCKLLGIIKENTLLENLPLQKIGNIVLIGWLFQEKGK